MAGGGGGEMSFPKYLSDTHKQLLYLTPIDGLEPWSEGGNSLVYSIFGLINTATVEANSPYHGETAFDPAAAQAAFASTSPLGRIKTQFDTTTALFSALDATTDWDTFLTKAATKTGIFADIEFLDNMEDAIGGLLEAVEAAMESSVIDDMVVAFENKKKIRFKRDLGQWSAGMADINAVHTSSFVWGQMLLQNEFAKEVDAFEAELKNTLFGSIVGESISNYLKANVLRVSNQDALIIQGTNLMSELNNMKVQLQGQLLSVKTEIEKLTMIVGKEQKQEDLQIDVQDALWDLEVTMYGANMLAAVNGAPAGRKEASMSKGQSALSGAFAGASIGAKIGGGTPAAPYTTAAGMLIGAIMGYSQ